MEPRLISTCTPGRNISNSLLEHLLKCHASTLQVLKLDECRPQLPDGRALTCDVLEALIMGTTALKVLKIRHVCTLDSGFVVRVVQACSTLEQLVLDKCDFKMGIGSVGIQPFGKLRFIQVRVEECTA